MSKYTKMLSAGRPSARNNRTTTLASLSNEGDMKRINFELSADLRTKLKIYAAKQGKTIKEVLTEFVVELPD